MKLWLAILLLLIFVGLGVAYGVMTHKDPSAPTVEDEAGCPFGRDDPVTVKAFTYTDADQGYTLTLPAGYTVPEMGSLEGNDPHFYNCATEHWFELQIGLEEYVVLAARQKGDMKVETALFPGATVSGGLDPNGGGESWAYWYTVVYPEQERAFRLGTNHSLEEYPLFESFKVF